MLEIERFVSRVSNILSEIDISSMLFFFERWDDKYVKLLIFCYGDYKYFFGKGKVIKREIFLGIVYSFNR